MRLIEVDCPVCSANDYKVVFPDTLGPNPPVFGYKWVPEVRKMYRAVRCKACGHMYCSPRLEDMYKHYKDVIDECYLLNEGLRVQTARYVVETIRRFVPSGRMLDVGCSTGDFLWAAKDHYDVEGLELSQWATEVARKRDLNIHVKKLEDMNESHGTYDVVTMWGVIEHLEHPKREMRHVNRLLNKGGVACFWTGDADSFYAKLMGRRWWYILGQHIQFFSWKSMDRLMEDSGFERVHKGIYPYVISCEYLAVSLSRYFLVGTLAKVFFKLFGLEKRKFILKKSDEMFGIYRKVRDLDGA